jgi:hypothetical protein
LLFVGYVVTVIGAIVESGILAGIAAFIFGGLAVWFIRLLFGLIMIPWAALCTWLIEGDDHGGEWDTTA